MKFLKTHFTHHCKFSKIEEIYKEITSADILKQKKCHLIKIYSIKIILISIVIDGLTPASKNKMEILLYLRLD